MIMKNDTRKQVLIVDDEPALTQMLTMLLETRGYSVNVAYSGKEAIKCASSNLDIILLDLVLPDVEGFEICRRLKEERITSQVPIIILSARYLNEDKIEGLYLGADDYLTKPFENEELFARMEAVLRRHSMLKMQSHREQNGIIIELRKIINEELIVPFFQPIYLFQSSLKLFGFEVLSRPKTRSVLSSPELLFKTAIRFGLYCDLEMLSWRKAFKEISKHIEDEKIFLNCSPYLVEGPQFDQIKGIFEENKIRAENVILEITERSAISDFKIFYKLLRRYRDLGFIFAVDDVGGGYASLEAIVETRPEVVKIDRHIVTDLHNDAYRRSVVKFIVSFCREHNILSIAEGVETKEDLETIKELGVDGAQGYFLCRPTAKINIEELRNPAHLK